MISWRMAAAWFAALVAATVLTWQIVGLADSQVGGAPAALTPNLESTTKDPILTTSTSTTSSTTSSVAVSSTTTTVPAEPSSSSTSPTSSTTSSSSSTTSAASEEWSVRTVNTAGGTVVVRYRREEVELQAATPVPGFSVEVDESGPPRVRVEFENDLAEVRVEVRWEDDGLDIDIDEDD